MNTIGSRLREERTRLGKTQEDLWTAGGVKKSAQLNYESDKTAPDARYLANIAELGVDIWYVLMGHRADQAGGVTHAIQAKEPAPSYAVAVDGQPLRIEARTVSEGRKRWDAQELVHNYEAPRNGDSNSATSGALLPCSGADEGWPLVLTLSLGDASRQRDYEVIPKLLGSASAGPVGGGIGAGDALQFDRAGEWAMTYEWLRRNLGHTSGELASITVDGDSMAPTLLDGDTIVIDRGVNEVKVDGVYVIAMRGNRLVKRLQRKFDQSLVIISDNNAYERETVPRGWESEIRVLGRMVWPRVR